MVTINGFNVEFKVGLILGTAINQFFHTEAGSRFLTGPYFAVVDDKFISQDKIDETVLKEGSVITVYNLAEGG